MKTILIISPHLDDAVLSCGATIAALAAQGCHIVTATVFTQPGSNTPMINQYIIRQEQDEQALHLLGATCIHLGYTDAPFRNSQWNSFSTLLFHHHTPPGQLQLVQQIAAAIQELIQSLQPEEVWFPLGTGGHIDHQLVWHSSHLLSHFTQQKVYYEECPYAMVPGWPAIRWHYTGATPLASASSPPLHYAALTDISLAFIDNYITNDEDKAASLQAWNNEWCTLPHLPETITRWQYHNEQFICRPFFAEHAYFQQLCKAIACYTTEWPALFGPLQENIATTLSQNIHNHQYCEKYWYKN